MNKSQICTIFVLTLLLAAGFVSIEANRLQRRYQIESGMTSPRMEAELNYCYSVLDECKAQGILDEDGAECYRSVSKKTSLTTPLAAVTPITTTSKR